MRRLALVLLLATSLSSSDAKKPSYDAVTTKLVETVKGQQDEIEELREDLDDVKSQLFVARTTIVEQGYDIEVLKNRR